MSFDTSDLRRRRLLQRGLIGGTPQDRDASDDFFNIDDDQVQLRYSPDRDVAAGRVASIQEYSTSPEINGNGDDPVEVATRAFLTSSSLRCSDSGFDESEYSQPSFSNRASSIRDDVSAGLATIQSLLAGKQALTWVFTGDNTVQGAFYTNGFRSFVEIFSERVRAELRRSMDVVINTGIGGDTIGHAITTLDERVLRFNPDVVAISLGLNDAKRGINGVLQFEVQCRKLLEQIRIHGAIPLLILPHPVCIASMSRRDSLPEYVEVLKRVSSRDEVACVDHWDFWLKHWPSTAATRSRLHKGKLHLNADSHRRLANLLFETLGIFDPQSPCCQVGASC